MHAPLCDNSGNVRYYLGAQVDVSCVFKDGVGLDSLQRVLEQQNDQRGNKGGEISSDGITKTSFQQLSQMFDTEELRTVQHWSGQVLPTPTSSTPEPDCLKPHRQSLILREPSLEHLSIHPDIKLKPKPSGFYTHYMLVRPYPSLRILFASPSLRIPELVQSPVMDKIGGSMRVRDDLIQALAAGRGVTARIRWISRVDEKGRRRWIHFTPLLRKDGQIGVWVVLLVDDEESQTTATNGTNMDNQSETEWTFPSVASAIPVSKSERSPQQAGPVTVTPPIIISHEHRPKISWSGPEVAPELRRASLNWAPPKQFEKPMDDTVSFMTIDSGMTALTAMTGMTGHSGLSAEIADEDVTFESLEERLRRKRARDARRMGAGVGDDGLMVGRRTYKSLSPYSFLEGE